MGTWGGSAAVSDLGIRIYFLHKAFPDIVGTDYTLRAANYLLGTHPVSSTSYVSSVGTSSKLKAYGNNRADNTFIPGDVIPGYIVIKRVSRSASTTLASSGSRTNTSSPTPPGGLWRPMRQTRS
jgi:hypothetical protein